MDLIPAPREHASAPVPVPAATVRTRVVAAGAAVVTVGAGLGLRAVAAGSVAKYGGDALYTVLVLSLVVLVAPRLTPLRAAGTALAISWAVEFLQLSPLPAELAQRSAVARLILGSTFNAPDLFWYAAGAAAGCLVHAAWGPRRPRSAGRFAPAGSRRTPVSRRG
ncbi:DUF2809 domain-containing protein [Streptomyces sp. NBC_01276]|uniref:ribosomal maturation YjgA family protein n=1 Tax=Streptomyces sp. NBC_01276 TaxID=2903808 RepID=UPI00352EE322